MTARPIRVVAMVCAMAAVMASPAVAGGWIITPFVGTTFGADTNLVALGNGGGSKKTTIGGTAGFLTDGIFGAEASASYSFGFFTSDSGPLPTAVSLPGTTQHSALSTFTGDALFALPIAVVHESLRPYAALGGGLMHATTEDITGFQPVHRNLPAMDVGGGVIGFVNNRAGFRFDVRRYRSLAHETSAIPFFGGSRLSVWRLYVGVVVRLGER